MRFSAVVAPAVALLTALCIHGVARAEPLKLLTEEYPPFNYEDGEVLKGVSVDQVTAIMSAAKLDYTMELMPWARAFSLAETTRQTCVFTTAQLPERLAHFKWVQPLVLDNIILVRKAGKPYSPKTLEEAKAFSIGVHRDDSAETYAKAQGFPNLDSAASLELSLKKLLSDRVQLMMMNKGTFDVLRSEGQPIEAALDVVATRAGIACNLAVPDATIAAMQAELDKLIADGTQAAIGKRYEQGGK